VNNLSRISTVQLANNAGSTIPNLVFYSTPDISGFKLNVNYGNQDTGTSTVDAKLKTTAVSGTYANGPLYIGLGTGNIETTAGTAVSKVDAQTLGASYDFGKVKVSGNYMTGKTTTAAGFATTATETNLGVLVPMGKVTFIAQIGRNTVKDDALTDLSGSDYVLGVDYALSARTAVFLKTGTYGKLSGTNITDTTYDTKTTSTAFGIKTTF
jgi:predicted porin